MNTVEEYDFSREELEFRYADKRKETLNGYTAADIDEMEDDLMYARDALRDVLSWMECSQSISALRAICKRGLRE